MAYSFTFIYSFLFFHDVTAPQWVRACSLPTIHDHTQTHHTRYASSQRVFSPTRRPLHDNRRRHLP